MYMYKLFFICMSCMGPFMPATINEAGEQEIGYELFPTPEECQSQIEKIKAEGGVEKLKRESFDGKDFRMECRQMQLQVTVPGF